MSRVKSQVWNDKSTMYTGQFKKYIQGPRFIVSIWDIKIDILFKLILKKIFVLYLSFFISSEILTFIPVDVHFIYTSYRASQTCTTHKRPSIPMWKWLWLNTGLLCEILASLWRAGRGWGHTARLSRPILINCFQAARSLCFYCDQNIFQGVQFSYVWALFLRRFCQLVPVMITCLQPRLVKQNTCAPSENRVACIQLTMQISDFAWSWCWILMTF